MVCSALLPPDTVPAPHPDAGLIARTQAALDWWSEQTPQRPTSSITGGGAIAAVEQALGALLGGRTQVLALPNATFGLRTALLALGVGAGDDVLISGIDYPAARAVVGSLGGRPVPVPVDRRTLTMDPYAAARRRTPRTRAAIVTHLHGICADIPCLREALGDQLPIVEDAAQALGSSLTGRFAGTLADVAVFSLGPAKAVSAGELGLLVTPGRRLFQNALRVSQHPIRQLFGGILQPEEANLAGRPAPLAALVGAYELSRWPERAQRLRRAEAPLRQLLSDHGVEPISIDRRSGQPGRVPIILDAADTNFSLAELDMSELAVGSLQPRLTDSGAHAAPDLPPHCQAWTADLVARTRIVELIEKGLTTT